MPNVTDSIAADWQQSVNPRQELTADSVCLLSGKVVPSVTFASEAYFRLNPDFVSATQPAPEQPATPGEVYGAQARLVAHQPRGARLGVGLPREYPLGTSWYYLPFLLLPLLALLIMRYTRGYLKLLPLLLVSAKAAEKQRKINLQSFNRMLLFLSAFAFAPACILCLHMLRSYPNSYQNHSALELLGYLMAFFAACVVVKRALLRFGGTLTYSQELVRRLCYSARIYVGAWGLLTFPLILLLTMNEEGNTEVALAAVYISCLAFFVLYLFRTLQLFLSERVSLFFWILYLCALEILPILLVIDYLFPTR